jgi:large subunit ribosomal protein L9
MARIKVLLMEDVPELGLAGDIFTVAGGYARNYLMPRGMAILATKGAIKQAEDIRQAGIRRRAKMRASAEAQAQIIENVKLLFEANAGENGRLYGSVTASDIAEKLGEAVGFEIDRRKIALGSSLRDLGVYDLELRLMPEVSAMFKVAVVREGETWDDANAREAAKNEAEEQTRAAEAAAAAAEAEAQQTEEVEVDEADDEIDKIAVEA